MSAYTLVVLGTALTLLAALTLRLLRRQPALFRTPLHPGPLPPSARGGEKRGATTGGMAFFIATRGLLVAVAALLQISAAYFPGLGHFLSAFAAVPISLAASSGPRGGLWTYLATAGVILATQPGEMPIFALSIGPLGFAIGWGAASGRGRAPVWLAAATILFLGMAVLTFVVGIPALGDVVSGPPRTGTLVLFAVFAGTYAWAWLLFTEEVFRRLARAGLTRPGSV